MLALAVPHAFGQAALTDLTASPIAGAGREYLTSPHETVDPATGQLALRIPVTLPSSRGFALQFAIAYDSGTRVSFVPNDSRTFANSYLDRDGWSYTVPNISFLYREVPYYGYDSYGDYVQLGTCDDLTNYVYSDDSGGRLDLGMERAWDPAGTPPPNDACTELNINGNSSPGGWNGGIAWFDPTRYDTDNVIDLSTDDGLQMTMLNPEHYREGGGTNVSPSTVTLIDRLTDRNGNIYRITDNGGGKIVYTDSDGRTALSTSGFADSSDTISVASGQTWTVTWQSGTAQAVSVPSQLNYTPTGHTCPADAGLLTPSTSHGITTIQLPNGTTFALDYDPVYGQVSRLTYPSGAYVRYTWGFGAFSEYAALSFDDGSSCTYMAKPLVITDRYVSLDGVHETLHQSFTYTASSVGPRQYMPDTRTTTVRDYDENNTLLATRTYTFDDTQSFRPQATTIQTQSAQGQVVRTVQQSWGAGAEMPPTTVTTTLENGKVARTVRSYSGDQLIEQDDYDYGNGAPGPLLRKVLNSYLHYGNIPTSGAPTLPYLVDRPIQTEVFSGTSSIPASATIYCYDQMAVTAVSSLTGHDEANYGAGFNQRGNLTQKLEWVNPPGGGNALPSCGQATGANALSSTFSYDEAGRILFATDPASYTTRYTWGDATGSSVNGTDAFLLQVQDPDTSSPKQAHHVESYTWDYATGHLLSHTDQNQQTTSYSYNDALGRLTAISFPDGGQTTVAYNDAKFNLYTEIRRKIDSRWTDDFTYFDGLGHPVTTCQANGDSSLPWDRVDTQYDGEGRIAFRSYPYSAASCTGANSEPGDSFAWDVLGRPLTVTHSDGSVLTTSYQGAAIEIADEGNAVDASGAVTQRVTRVLQHDGLGRLTAVCEVSPSLAFGADGTAGPCNLDLAAQGFLTTYQYDALDDLTAVNQGSLVRQFSYDSLGRLLSARNPESGATSYGYDSDSNLIRKQDANGTVTTYAYDPLHRLASRSFTLASGVAVTPNVELDYDSDPTGRTTYNAVGHLTRVWNGQVELSFNQYDPMGRPEVLDTAIGGISYHSSLRYDFLGFPTWELLPSGRQLYLTDDIEGRSRWIGDGQYTSFTYVSARYYDAAGQPEDEYLGNGLLQGWHYDNRGRLIKLTLEDPNHPAYTNWRMDLNVDRLPDSNVADLVDNLGHGAQDQIYAYDALNRLVHWSTSAGLNCDLAADRYGNLTSESTDPACGMPIPHSFNAANQIVGNAYDADGELVSDTAGSSWSWNGEGQLAAFQVTSPSHSGQYVYDGLGRRVEKVTDGVAMLSLRNALGQVVDEVTGSTWTDSINVPGAERVALVRGSANGSPGTAATVTWLHADQVGTTRLLTDASGNNLVQCNQNSTYPQGSFLTYAPFGAELDCTQSQTDYKFTGKEQDAESDLVNFDFRYYAPVMGRFTRPDEPFAGWDQHDPNSFNLYSYVENNPIGYTDPDGHDVQICITSGDQSSQVCVTLTDEQYAELYQQQNGQQGITLPGGTFPTGDITCDGQVCGTARYIEPALEDESLDLFMLGDAALSVGKSIVGGMVGMFSKGAAEEGTVVIGKMTDLNAKGALAKGERTLDLPNLGDPQANWAQNSSRLREAMNEGRRIRDASAEPLKKGRPANNTGFLRMERNLLENHGWTYHDGYWYPPSK